FPYTTLFRAQSQRVHRAESAGAGHRRTQACSAREAGPARRARPAAASILEETGFSSTQGDPGYALPVARQGAGAGSGLAKLRRVLQRRRGKPAQRNVARVVPLSRDPAELGARRGGVREARGGLPQRPRLALGAYLCRPYQLEEAESPGRSRAALSPGRCLAHSTP